MLVAMKNLRLRDRTRPEYESGFPRRRHCLVRHQLRRDVPCCEVRAKLAKQFRELPSYLVLPPLQRHMRRVRAWGHTDLAQLAN